VCKFTPLFMCNPYEDTADTLAELKEEISSTAERRKLIELKRHPGAEKGEDAFYAPGDFGFLETGAEGLTFRQSLAKIEPEACFSQNGVTTKTGNNFSAHVPLNTRFDMYGGPFNKNNADYAPAENVTKGYLPEVKTNPQGKVTSIDYCKPSDDPTDAIALSFPIDGSFDGETRVGTGDWGGKFENYWSINHPGVEAPHGWSSDNLPTRYDVYRWEIDNGDIPNNSDGTPMGENGKMADMSSKRCSQNEPTVDPDRRVLYAAIVNCKANPFKGHTVGLPVVAFVKMFMTQPMMKVTGKDSENEESDGSLYLEMIDVVEPGVDDEVVHDIVQLYR
jgi:hypothetical protein